MENPLKKDWLVIRVAEQCSLFEIAEWMFSSNLIKPLFVELNSFNLD